MDWQDQGLVLSTRRHGERDAILEVMTAGHGRHLGLVRGGRSSRQAPALQPGNRVQLSWRARLEDHLGQFTAETLESRAGIVLTDPLALHTVMHLAALVRLLPERSPHPAIFEASDAICTLLAEPALLAPIMIRFELMILSDLGFGLDLDQCAATGSAENLVYVSPKSGRAVSAEAGAPWADRMLDLPPFLLTPWTREPAREPAPLAAIASGFRLAGYFLERHLFEPRGLPLQATRAAMLQLLMARLESGR
jgi:DNA repair protein RecO (recombination protein O)